jgi:putative membrane protein
MTQEPDPDPSPAAYVSTKPQRTNPITAVVKAGQLIPLLIFFVFTNGVAQSLSSGQRPWAGAGGALIVVAFMVFQYLSWTRFTYWFDADGDLRISSGILQVSQRRVQLSRLQSVEVTQPLLARLFGLADVRPEVAGAERRHLVIGYLTLERAYALRAELLARAAGVRAPEPETPAPVAPENALLSVPTAVVLESSLLSPAALVAVVVIVVMIVFSILSQNPVGMIPVFIAVIAPLAGAINPFLTYFGFTVAESPDGLRLRFGLTSHQLQTVPPGRVQAVRIEAPVLWRHRGWVRVVINVAGSPEQSETRDHPRVLLPAGPIEVAHMLVQRVLPGVDIQALPMSSVPRSARWRAPLQRRRLAAGSDDAVFVARHGWLVPAWDAVPHARVQSVRVSQGPWQRRLGLATVHLDSTPGPIKPQAAHRATDEARVMAEAQIVASRQARRNAPPERWMRPPSSSGEATP